MLKLQNSQTTSSSNGDPAPLPERRRSTFREPAAEVDLGLFGLPKGEPEGADELESVDVSELTDAVEATDVVEASASQDSPDVPDATDVPDASETPAVTAPVSPDAPVAAPSQRRPRHRADRAGNRRATGSSAFRAALPAH